MTERLSYRESCLRLQSLRILDEGDFPPLPERPPKYDDEVLGLSFFRTQLANCQLENLTLCRTFFGRSDIRKVSFRYSDLTESVACWNDFTEVDFISANLSKVDLRASIFREVIFDKANLCEADLRHSTFKNCSFINTDLSGAKLVRGLKWFFLLSSSQRRSVDWHSSPGEKPAGG